MDSLLNHPKYQKVRCGWARGLHGLLLLAHAFRRAPPADGGPAWSTKPHKR